MVVLALVMVALLAWIFWSDLKTAVLLGLSKLGITPLWQQKILAFTKPRPDSPAAVFTFTGADVGHRFFGMVTSQDVIQQPPNQPARIVVPD